MILYPLLQLLIGECIKSLHQWPHLKLLQNGLNLRDPLGRLEKCSDLVGEIL